MPATVRGFSIVEVTLALGIIGFALLATIALLPVGLDSEHVAEEQSRAAVALNMVASAAESLRNTNATTPTWAFPSYFSNDPNASTNPTLVSLGQSPWNLAFFVNDAGLFIPTSDTTTTKRQTLYVKVYPPQTIGQPVRIYAAAAWPSKPTDSSSTTPDQMKDRQGFVETIVAYVPK